MTCTSPRVTSALAGRPATGSPLKRIAPVMRPPTRDSTPETAISSVLFPAAFAPTMATISPAPTSNVTPQSTWMSPYQLSMPTASSKQVLLAEVGIDDPRMARDRGGRAVGDHL